MPYLFFALIASLALNGLQMILHHRERRSVMDRFMAQDFRTFQYFDKAYPGEVKDKEAKMEAERERKKTEAEILAEAKAQLF
jgi:hypothetical protein